MKSNFAQLEEAVDAAIAYELGEIAEDEAASAGIAPERHRQVAGLRVVSNAARDKAVDAAAATRFRNLNLFRADAKILTDKLARAGITPLVTLPYAAWDRLCKQSKLFRLTPDQHGVVRISLKEKEMAKVRAAKEELESAKPVWALLAVPVVALLSFASTFMGVHPGAALVIFILASFILCGVTASMLSYARDEERVALEKKMLRRDIGYAMESKSICKRLWPEYVQPSLEQSRVGVRVSLPTPPAEVQKILVDAERLGIPLYTAMDEGAIHILENPADALLNETKTPIPDRPIWDALFDPIVYAVDGNAVAVVAQFGEFRIEQDIINEVVNSVYLV